MTRIDWQITLLLLVFATVLVTILALGLVPAP